MSDNKVEEGTLCECNLEFAIVLCSDCGKPIGSLCVADFHYKLGPLCYTCHLAEQKRQQELSVRAF